MKNNETDIYTGQTDNYIGVRCSKALSSGVLESSDILINGEFMVTIFGYVNPSDVANMSSDYSKNVIKIFEDVFIHVFTRFPQLLSRNKAVPKLI